MMENIDEIKNLPNFNLSLLVSQKILQLPKKIKVCLVVACLENETCASIQLPALASPLTDQAKINVLLEVMNKLQIPFKSFEKYGNLERSKIGLRK